MCWQKSQIYFSSPSMTLIIGLGIPAETRSAKHRTSTAWLPWVYLSPTHTVLLLHVAHQGQRFGQESARILLVAI
jgi:hypothetical protein